MKRLALLVLVLVSACAPWTQVGGLYSSEGDSFSVDLPQGWMKSNTSEHLVITRDGLLLQNIMIEKLPVAAELKYTKKKLKTGMMPQEVAEVMIDNISSNQDLMNVEVSENVPVKVSGLPGFRAVLTYQYKGGLKLRSVYCGVLAGDWFYGIRYSAAARHYFEKDLSTFEKVIESFRITKTA